MERIAKNNPSKRNSAQAGEARAGANKAELMNASAETFTTESTESGLGKAVDKIDMKVLLDPRMANPVNNKDNVTVVKPLPRLIPK